MVEAVSDAEDLAVDMDGSDVGGVRTWDFSAALTGDVLIEVQALPLSDDLWFKDQVDALNIADDGMVYVSLLSENVWGVFHRTDGGLFIHAIADVDDEGTFIRYEPAITALQYPLTVGDHFQSVSDGEGTFDYGALGTGPYYSTDTYTSDVVDSGIVTTSVGDYEVLRVETTQHVVADNGFGFPLATVDHKQVIFLTACTGAIVSVTSAEGAADFSFEVASRVKRIRL